MLISKINKNYFLNAPHQKASGFGHSLKKDYDIQNPPETDKTFVNMSDKDLYKAASILPNEKFNRIRNNAAGTLFVGVPVFDIVAHGVVKQGAVASKMKAMAQRSGLWGLMFATVLSLMLVKNKANKNSVALDNIEKHHPVMHFGMDATYITGVWIAANAIKENTGKFISKKYGAVIEKIKAPVRKVLNNSVINKRIIAPLDKEITKIAKGNRAPLNIAAEFVAPTVMTAILIRCVQESKARNKNIQENYTALKSLQTGLREYDRKNI